MSRLHDACVRGDLKTVKFLIKHSKHDLNIQDSHGNTPLHLACKSNLWHIIIFLLKMRCSTKIPNRRREIAQKIPLNEDGDCLLHIACQRGEMDIVRYLIIDENCDPNVQNYTSFNTPLHIAAKYGQGAAIVQLLSCEECNPNYQNREFDTPLHIAAKHGQDGSIVQLLSYRECNPNVQNQEGNTPLHVAIRYEQEKSIVELLSSKECDLNVQNYVGDTPLHIASKRKSLDIIKILLERRCSTIIPNEKSETAQNIPLNENGDCLLHIACQWGNVGIIRYLTTDENCSPNVQNFLKNTPLHALLNVPTSDEHSQSNLVAQMLSSEACDPNIQNKEGDTPLHIAVMKSRTPAISQLLTNEQCNPNVQNQDGDTPLHCAVRYEHKNTLVQLLSYEECIPNVQNKEGDTPLHIASKRKSLDIIKILLERRCSTNIPNKKGETAQNIPLNENGDCLLHIACQWGDVGIVRYLTTDENCSPNVQNFLKNTPLHALLNVPTSDEHSQSNLIAQLLSSETCNPNVQNKEGDTPLHIAVMKSRTPAISQFLTNEQCIPNVQNKGGDTPLHIASKRKSLDIIKILLERRCSTNIPNKKGETAQNIPLNEDGDCLLHIACQWGDVDIVKYLIAERCNPNALNNDHMTPLLTAIKHNNYTAATAVLQHKNCNLTLCDLHGNTPLHLACIARESEPELVELAKQLLTRKQCNPNVLNNDHLTPLLTAIKHNNHTTATALLQHKDCDLTLRDPHGNTPLHLACISGETQLEMVEVAKQLLTSVDPSCVNKVGQTPIELTTNYQLIQAISYFVKCKTKQSVQTYINMFIVGNPETGKSTLVKAICKEATSVLWKIVPKQVRKVKNVPLHTAGIIPTTFRSKTFGNTVLYDLAGQVEYYTSHAAVIKSTVISTPPAFVVVVNLSESEEKISQTLRYWWSFIDNHAARSSAPPQVILVGSHADVVKSTGRSVQEKMTQLLGLLKQLSASFHFAGQVALDCRDPASRKLQLFCSLVNQSCTVLREKADVDLRCHVLYAFLLERFKDKVACTVSDVATSVKENSALLPHTSDSLIPLISTLSDKGLLLLVKGGESHGDWWIMLQKQALFNEINGAIFAPKDFTQHKDLSWSTGVVPFSKLKNEFPDYNSNMVTEFLTHLEFCFKIEDHQTLALLKEEAAYMEDTSTDVLEEYYFFPALVSVDNPLHVWERNDAMCCKCGWFYECIQPDQFLTTQFLHVLILRLAFTFALQLDPGDSREDSLALCRKCSVWKHGIAWVNRVRIETVVEVGLQYQSVIVMMRCPKGKEAKCAQLRSEVIQKVLEAKDEHCKAVKMSESFINPTDIRYPFTNNMEDVKFYSLTEIGRGIVCKGEEANALDRSGRNPIPVQDLLLFDPHSTDTATELPRELFSRKHSMKETVRSEVLETLNKDSKPKFANSEWRSVMNQFNPVTLHIQQTDETTKRAVQLFVRQVVLILHTCNANEYWAALEKLEPPTADDGSKIRDHSITYPQVGSVIGWFAGYRTAVVRTGQGNRCRDELTTALTKLFPNGKAVIGAGIAYANDKKRKFADVLISDQIEDFVQYKIVDGKITNQGPREQIDANLRTVFENPARDWTDMKRFTCTDDNQTSVAHIGCIVSAPTLVRDEVLRDQLMKHTPDCIGGEIEGWVLLELKKTLKSQHNKDIEVIVIKGVAGYGDCTKGDQWQWTAAKAAMDCIHFCLNKSGGIKFSAIPQPAAINDMEPEAAISNTTPPSTKPTLPELMRFSCTDRRIINIPMEIGTEYVQFGIFLLDDLNGARVKSMAHHHLNKAKQINTEILQEWLTGRGKKPVTWTTLVEVLHDIELSALAGEIEAVKCPQDQSPKT